MIDVLMRDIEDACAHLAEERPGQRKGSVPDLWTAPALLAAHQKARTGQRRT
jgi:glutamate decarboxylase